MLQIAATAVVIFQRSRKLVGILLNAVQRGDRQGVKQGAISLCVRKDATDHAEAVAKAGFSTTWRNPRVIAQLVLVFLESEIFRRHDREPEVRLAADQAIAARRALVEIDLDPEFDRDAVTSGQLLRQPQTKPD